jgi:hypothetical protein
MLHIDALYRPLPAYQSITTVSVGHGSTTSFWHYSWLPTGPLAINYPSLFSPCTMPTASVRDAMSMHCQGLFTTRLSEVAMDELIAVEVKITTILLELMIVGCLGSIMVHI